MNAEVSIAKFMRRWRARDEALGRGTWRGVTEIAGNVQRPKKSVREELAALASVGVVERHEFANGIFWRASPSSNTGEPK